MSQLDNRMKEDVSSVTFCIESIAPGNGRMKFEQDDGGFYIGVPIAALGVSTRNNSYYDVESFVSHLQNPAMPFNQLLRNRELYGELGHPPIAGLEHNLAIARIREVREANTSHLFKKIYTGPKLESGGRIVYADLKPVNLSGPGARVKESLDDPEQNTAFSIRTLTSNVQKGSISYRKMVQFITADYVNNPGYIEAMKSFAQIGNESFSAGANDDFMSLELPRTPLGTYSVDGLSMECMAQSFTNDELNELFGSKEVTVTRRSFKLAPVSRPGNSSFQPIIGSTKTGRFLGGF